MLDRQSHQCPLGKPDLEALWSYLGPPKVNQLFTEFVLLSKLNLFPLETLGNQVDSLTEMQCPPGE